MGDDGDDFWVMTMMMMALTYDDVGHDFRVMMVMAMTLG